MTPTLQGFAAIILWSSLASLTALVGPVPPFLLASLTFAFGTLAGAAHARMVGVRLLAPSEIPLTALLLGVGGLLGYHVAYFFALQTAPRVEANLINYLWPLLIVVFSAFLPAHAGARRLRWWHVAGALSGFAGSGLALVDPERPFVLHGEWPGLAAALAAAVIWAGYSVASRLFAAVPSSALVTCCAFTSAGALLFHLVLETTHWPQGVYGWATVAVMGLGPVGLAFNLWDKAVKYGDLRLVGIAAYATPLLSTGLLAATGLASAGPRLWVAALLVSAGAAIAAFGDRWTASQ